MRSKYYLWILLFYLFSVNTISGQLLKSFTSVNQTNGLNADILLIGNNNLSTHKTNAYTGPAANQDLTLVEVDIDSDPTTTNSSRANLSIPVAYRSCYKIKYAALYWGATYTNSSRSGIDQVKFKVPNSATYQTVTGTVIHDATSLSMKPYAVYADVTNLLNVTNAEGTYAVANIKATTGKDNPGFSAGWHLYVIYENPNLPAKNITSFNGFANVNGSSSVDINVSGFQTIPAGPVNAKVAFATLEGDQGIVGDFYRINGTKMRPPIRNSLSDNFFNSSITDPLGYLAGRSPNSTNTLGYDAGIFNVSNVGNSVIANNATSADITLGTDGDVYYHYFDAFAVDVIQPKIVLTKTIETPAGTPIASGSPLSLGQTVDYVISLQNVGNDNATNVTIRDILPVNTVFSYPSGLTLPAGITVVSYNSTTRELILSVNKSLVTAGGGKYSLRIRVQVVPDCAELQDACENRINNQAFVSYQGVINTAQITDDPSYASYNACSVNSPSPTNFIGNIDDCKSSQNVYLCGTTTQLTAPAGYTTYTWTGPAGATITPVAGTNNQTVTVNMVGTYSVMCVAPSPCVNIPITFNVSTYGTGLVNPVITYLQGLPANSGINYDIKNCPDLGLDPQLPFLYLCGTNDTAPIVTNIAGATSIVWEQLNTGSCPAVANPNCANVNSACTWTTLATNPNFTVTGPGQYRVIINFPGGCDRKFYFNASLEFLDPQIDSRDIVCTTPGKITINNVPATGYEFSLSTAAGAATNVWQTSNVFSNINVAGNYTVWVRKANFPGGCLFFVPNIGIRQRNFTVTDTYVEPRCFGDKGSIRLVVNDVYPNYYFALYSGATATGVPLATSGPISVTNDYTFPNLNAGQTYTWLVTTDDKCSKEVTHTFANPAALTVSAAITTPLTTCSNGVITITPVGGTAPYTFIVNGISQGSNATITTTGSGTFNIQVVDTNNCSATTSQTINLIPTPVVTPAVTHPLCATSPNTGIITFNVISSSGQTLTYSVDGGPYLASNVFTGLAPGLHTTSVRYTINGVTCTLPSQLVSINTPTSITGSASITTQGRCDNTGATITVVMNLTGAGGLQFSIDGGITWVATQDFTNLGPGTYTIQVRDLNGCTISLNPVTVPALNGPIDMILVGQTPATSCTATGDLNVNISGSGGVTPVRYRIVSPAANATAYQASGNFGSLPAGTYTFEVIDANGCTYQEIFTLQSLPAPTITAQVTNDVVCFGQSNGNALFTISGLPNNVRYNYTVVNVANPGVPIVSTTGNPRTPSTGSTTLTVPITNQPAGTYQITFSSQDYDNCTYTKTLTIAGPAQALTAPFTFVNPTCTTNGAITVSPTGGWGSYTYSISPNAGVNVSGNVFSNLLPNVAYTITVTDAKGCTTSINKTFTAPPAITANITGDFCFDGTNAATLVVNVTTGTAPYSYSLNGGTPQSSNTFPNLSPGTYSVTITDANNCGLTINNQIIAPQLTVSTTLVKDITCSNPTSATINGTISGGIAPITITVSYNGGMPTPVASFPYTATQAGTYVFTVADAKCNATSNTITVTTPINPSATHVVTDVLCNGGNTGSVTITPSLGTAPYQINFNGLGFSAITNYTGLTAGSYNYIVRDSKGCIFNGTAVVAQPNNLTASHTVIPFSCNASNAFMPATITVTASQGTAPYQYNFNGTGYTNTNTLTINDNGTNQTITYSVKDANGCIVSNNVTLQKLNPPVIASITKSTITCAATTATIQINVTGGVAPLNYAIAGPSNATNTTGNFTNLPSGTYNVTVTDTNGCFATQSLTIVPVTPITITGTKLSDVLCNGGTSGAAVFTVGGFATTYNYTINGVLPGFVGQTSGTINLNNLSAGIYTINVVDPNTSCTANASITITEPGSLPSATLVATNVNCNNDVSLITVTPSGGTAPYAYAAVISGAAAPTVFNTVNPLSVDTNNAANLVWDVYVKDANGCIYKRSVTIISDPLPTVTVPTIAANQCSVATGFIFTATGTGIAPLSYSIDGVSFQSSSTFTVNSPGTYFVTIKDGNGCTAVSPTSITVYPQLSASLAFVKDLTCSNPTAGTMTLSVNGGKANYSYLVYLNNIATAINGTFVGPSTTISVNAAGNYTVLVTDANGCTYTTPISVTMTAAVPPVVANITKDPTCNGGTDGTLILNASGATAPYTYIVDGATPVFTNVFGGLAPGVHTYTVTDARGCSTSGSITLNNPAPIVVSYVKTGIVCNINTLGTFAVTINSGGTPNFTFNLLDSSFGLLQTSGVTAATTHTFSGLNFGFYYIEVIDAKGCKYLSPVEKIDPAPNMILGATVDSNNCATGVTVTVNTTGGVAPYDYGFFGQPDLITNTNSTTFTYTGINALSHGTTYYLQVRDANNCISVLEFTTPSAPSGINITGAVKTNVSCNGSANGSLQFTVQNYDPTVTNINYQLINALTNLPIVPAVVGTLVGPAGGPVTTTLTNLPPGNYNIKVTEATGTLCSANYNFLITQPSQPLNLVVATSVNANCNANAQVTVTATGGTPAYMYAFMPAGTPPGGYVASNLGVLDPAISLNWDIWVKDANNCTKMISHTIVKDALPTINAIPQQCYTGTTLNFTVNGTTFNGNIVYGMNTVNTPPAVFVATNTFSVSSAGTYYFFVKDVNSCIASTSVIVAPQLLLQANLVQDLACSHDATVNLFASQGTAPYVAYGVSTNVAGPFAPTTAGATHTITTAGTYYFQVTDTQGCTAVSNPIVVTPKTTPTFTFTQNDVSCAAGSDGSITITASNGLAPYLYSINNGLTYTSSNVFAGLSAATYPVMIKDAKDCISSVTNVIIGQPLPVIAGISLTQGLTCGVGNSIQAATVTANGAGGTPPYKFSFDGGTNYSTTATYSTVANGPVSVLVMDSKGCISAAAATLTVPNLTPPTDMAFSATAITCLATTSTVTVTSVTSGVGPYQYAILSPVVVPNQPGNIFGGLAPNTYLFQVTDANGCTTTKYFDIKPVINITASAQQLTAVSCNGGNNASIRISVGNFTGNYSYTVNGGAPVINQSSSFFDLVNLTAGSYTIVVTDNVTGCTATTTIAIGQPNAIGLNLVNNVNATCSKTGVVTVQGFGGTSPYSYEAVVAGSPAPVLFVTNNIFNLSSGSWDIWVNDANNCKTSINVNVGLDSDPQVILPGVAANQCTSDGTVYTFTATANPLFGIAPYQFSIDGVSYQASGTFNVTQPGLYTVTIKDKNDCTGTGTIRIYPTLNLALSVTADADCIPVNSGQITVSGSGGSGNYTYQTIAPSPIIIPAQAGNVFNNLTPGTYTVQINDTFLNPVTGLNEVCSKQATIEVEAPLTVNFSTVATDVSCNGGNNGTITVTTLNGNLPIIYSIIAGTNPTLTYPINSVANVFSNLPVGTYTVQGINNRNCSLQQFVTINEPTPLTVSAAFTPYGCNASNALQNAVITITANDGTPGYTYSINGTNFVSGNQFNIADNGAAQTFTLFVKDAHGCIANTLPLTIPAYVPVIASIDPAIVKITCTNNEQIRIVVSSGSGNYSYQYLAPTPAPVPAVVIQGAGLNVNQFDITQPGHYTFLVTDLTTLCSTIVEHDVTPYNFINADLTLASNVKCFGGNTGAMNLNIQNFTGNFNYVVHDALTNAVVQPTVSTNTNSATLITGLATGSYYVNITETSSPFCTYKTPLLTIGTAPELLISASETANVTCTNTQGVISASGNGGTGVLQYQLTGPVNVAYTTNNVFTGLSAGNYTVTVKDENNCTNTVNVTLSQPAKINANVPNVNLSCFGDVNGQLNITNVTGGHNIAANYTYTLNYLSAPARPSSGPQAAPLFTGLSAGNYSITINDDYDSCGSTFNFVVNQPTQVVATLAEVVGTQNCNNSFQNLLLSAAGGVPPYRYDISLNGSFTSASFASSIVIANVAPGPHKYYVMDANNCISVAQITIDTLEPLALNLISIKDVLKCFSDTDGSISVQAVGGLGGYIYNLTGPVNISNNTTGNFTGLPRGIYTITVTSGNPGFACTPVTRSFEIKGPNVPFVVTATKTDAKCKGGSDGIINLVITGGTGTIQYILTPLFGPQETFDITNPYATGGFNITNLPAGVYNLTVKDSNGCLALNKFPIPIGEPATKVFASIDIVNDVIGETCYGNMDGRVIIRNISGGTITAGGWYKIAIYAAGSPKPNVSTYTQIPIGQTTYDTSAVLAARLYNVDIIDSNGCSWTDVFEIKAGDDINPFLLQSVDCVNNVPVYMLSVSNNLLTGNASSFPIGTAIQLFEGVSPAAVPLNPVINVTAANQNVVFAF